MNNNFSTFGENIKEGTILAALISFFKLTYKIIFSVTVLVVLFPLWFIPFLYFYFCRKVKTDEDAKDIVIKICEMYAPMLFIILGVNPVDIEFDSKSVNDICNFSRKNLVLGTYGARNSLINFGQRKPVITLFYGSIRIASFNCKSLLIFQTLFILAHEIYHVYQDQTGESVFDGYIKFTENEAAYSKQKVEVDANNYAKKFILKRIPDVIKLTHNI